MPVSFESDYIAGDHPEILRRLAETNLESLPGYGADPYCDHTCPPRVLHVLAVPRGSSELLP